MSIFGSLAMEGLASKLGASRAAVQEMMDGLAEDLAHVKGDLSRRLDRVLASSANPAADVEAMAGDFLESEAVPSVRKHMLGILGAQVGLGVATVGGVAWVIEGSATAALLTVGGATITPILLVLAGLILLVFCGRYSVTVISELLSKLGQQMDKITE